MSDASHIPLPAIDIFCKVIDHFGDAGTAWRLCRELQHLLGNDCRIRLFIDEREVLGKLIGKEALEGIQTSFSGIEVLDWRANSRLTRELQNPAPVVIEMFGCTLPESLILQHKCTPRLIVNLEYFSCEDWAVDCHLRESLLDFGGVRKFFFFPGLDEDSGGIMSLSRPSFSESDILKARKEWLKENAQNPEIARMNWLSIYAYHNRFGALLDQLMNERKPWAVWALGRETQDEVQRICRAWECFSVASGLIGYTRGDCSVYLPRTMPQDDFDRLLALSDFLLVRGEDSLAGALISGTPFLWQLYPQQDDAHGPKLEAFLSALNPIWQNDVDRMLFQQSMRAFNFPKPGEEVDWQMLLSRRAGMKSALGLYVGVLRETCNLSKKLLILISRFFKE